MRVLYLSRGWSHHDQRFVSAWRDNGVEVVALALDATAPGDAAFAGQEFRDRMVSTIVAFDPDVVHAGPVTDIAAIAAELWEGPLIAMSWGFDLMQEIEDDPDARRAARAVALRADRFVVDNDAPRLKALELGAEPARIVQFPWGIDLGFFTPGDSSLRENVGLEPNTFVVLCTRKHEPMYGVRVVVDAFVLAASESSDLHLVLAGSGSETDDYRRAVAAAGLEHRVSFLGDLDQLQLRDAHRAADLYVSASYVDGTSISLLEAMACGAPVCVSSIPGNAQWVSDSTGLSFPPGDAEDLARLLGGSVSGRDVDEDQTRGRVAAARQLVHAKADWKVTAAGLPGLAADAIASRRS